MDPGRLQFARTAIRRQRVFRGLMWAGLVAGVGLLILAIWRAQRGEPWATTAVIAVFVLLNARGNLRQVKYAQLLKAWAPPDLLESEGGDDG